MAPKPNVLSENEIASHVLEEFDQGSLHNPDFVPKGNLKSMIKSQVVQATINNHYEGPERERLITYSTKNPKVFLTCVSVGKVSSIRLFKEAGFSDANFPVRNPGESAKLSSISSPDRRTTWDCCRDDDGTPWGADAIRRFIKNQWWFSAITFKDDKLTFKISKKCPLPYILLNATDDATDPSNDEGHYGEVHKMGLLVEHLKSRHPRYLSLVRFVHFHLSNFC